MMPTLWLVTDGPDRKQPKNPLGPTGSRVMDAVRQLRQSKGLTYKELSERLENLGRPIPVLGLSRLEKGERRVDVDDLVALAVALETAPNQLLLPEMDIEHAADMHPITPAVRETPPLLWAWATGEVPLGHLPSTAAADRAARLEEVAFSRRNRQNHWSQSPSASPSSHDKVFATTGIVAFVAEAFRSGASTAAIRTIVEGAIVAALSSYDPASGQTKIEVTEDRGIVIRLNHVDGEDE